LQAEGRPLSNPRKTSSRRFWPRRPASPSIRATSTHPP
jgi:hypothetical protein